MERYKMGWDFLEPVEFNGAASQEELDLIFQRGKELAVKVKEWVAAGGRRLTPAAGAAG
jgi:anaerobic nitric oxide reductase flavorubredoxin